jgi:hypothetical protein
MDVTSQLNLEREAGMGENTERQPAEPATAAAAEPRLEVPRGPVRPRGRTGHCLLSAPRCSSLASLPTTQADSCPAPPSPPNTGSFLPLEKQLIPKQQTENNK